MDDQAEKFRSGDRIPEDDDDLNYARNKVQNVLRTLQNGHMTAA